MTDDPVKFVWQGDAMVPATKYQAHLADKQYVVGELYLLIEHDEPTQGARGFFFVRLKNLWMSLPEALEKDFPTPERFRFIGLIKNGFADHDTFVCNSEKQAKTFAAFLARNEPENTLISFEGSVVHKMTAHSMKGRSMNAKTFREAADKVLDWAAALVGTTKEQVPESDT